MEGGVGIYFLKWLAQEHITVAVSYSGFYVGRVTDQRWEEPGWALESVKGEWRCCSWVLERAHQSKGQVKGAKNGSKQTIVVCGRGFLRNTKENTARQT